MNTLSEKLRLTSKVVDGLEAYASKRGVDRGNLRPTPWGPAGERDDRIRQRHYIQFLGGYAVTDLSATPLISAARQEMQKGVRHEFGYRRRLDTVLRRTAGEAFDLHNRSAALAYTDEEELEARRMIEGGDSVLRALENQYFGRSTSWDQLLVLEEYPDLSAIPTMSSYHAFHRDAHDLADSVRHENIDLLETMGCERIEPEADGRELDDLATEFSRAMSESQRLILDATFMPPDLPITEQRRRVQLISRRACYKVWLNDGEERSPILATTQYLRIHPEDRSSTPDESLIL